MRTYKYILILAALTLGVNAQTILVTTNNVLDLNPERDAISALEGAIRIRHTITDGSEVLDVSAGFPIPLTIASRVDGYTNSVINTITNDGVGVVWWVIPFLNAGEYELKSTVTLPGDSFEVFDRYLSVTSAPSAAGDIFITNNVSVGDTSVTNIFQSGAFNINVTNIYNTGVETINSVDGNLTFEGNAVTQTGTVFNFSYVDTDSDDGFTNIATEGSGNVVTNLLYGGRVITQQLGTVSGGGGGGLDHWAASNTTDATYLYPTGATHRQTYPYIVAYSNNGVSIGGITPPTITSIGSVRIGGSGGTLSGGSGSLIAGGRDSSITGVGAQATIVGGRNHSITAGDEWTSILGGYENTLGGGRFGGTILGGRSASLTDGGSGCTIVGGYINSINTANGDYETVVGGYANSITSANDYNTVIGNQGCNITAGSWATIIGGYDADSTANYTLTSGYEINNTHAGTYMFRTYDGDATEWDSARTNSFIIKTGGVGINTNNPQADLHVAGNIIVGSENFITNEYTSGYAGLFGNGILGGEGNTMNDTLASVIVGGWDNRIVKQRRSFILGGQNNLISASAYADNNVIVGGNANEILSGDDNNFIGGGTGNEIRATALANNVVVGGQANDVRGGSGNFVGGGNLTRMLAGSYNFMGAGQGNIIRDSDHSVVLGGYYNDLKAGADKSAILAGSNNILYGTNSILLQGSGVTVSNDNIAVVADDLEVRGKIYLGALGDYLTADGTNLFYYNSTGGVAQVTSL